MPQDVLQLWGWITSIVSIANMFIHIYIYTYTYIINIYIYTYVTYTQYIYIYTHLHTIMDTNMVMRYKYISKNYMAIYGMQMNGK